MLKHRIMRVRVLCLAVSAVASVGTSEAQEQIQVSQLPAYAQGPTWTGFYLGVGFGGGLMIDRVSSSDVGNLSIDAVSGQGALASIYGGVDYQVLPRAVVGVLAEGTYSNIASSASAQVPGAAASISQQANWGWSALVRAGVLPAPSTLLYALGGYAGQNLHTTGTAVAGATLATFARDDVFHGWTIGGGIETRLRGGWSTKLEYRYSQFGARTLPGATISASPSLHAARLGLTYKFGGLADSPPDDAPAPEAAVNWTGIYVGAAAGASATTDRLGATFGGATATMNGGGQELLGSAFGGFDFQIDERAVMGLMGDLAWTGPQSTTTISTGGASATFTSRTNMTLSVMGRLGFLATPSTLLYAAGGYSGAFITSSGSATLGAATTSRYRDDYVNGWTVGPGVETIIFGGWSTRLEYRYAQYEEKSGFGGLSVQPSMHSVRAGLSYKFGTAQPQAR